MLRERTYEDHEDDPAVRRTLRLLRGAVVVSLVATVASIAIAVTAVRTAWREGVEAGAAAGADAAAAASSTPSLLALVMAGVGVGIAGVATWAAIRRPWTAAVEQAMATAEASRRLHDGLLETFAALNAAVEAKDRYTAGHGLRVTLVSVLIGQELELAEEDLDVLRLAATFHDIGKIAVPDRVLQKTGRLSDSEFDAMKVHPTEGARICGTLEALRPAVPMVRGHHERVDGAGYPDGLSGEAIPLGARIIAVADTWDAITSDRPYRSGEPAFIALAEIRRCSGTQFDPRVVDAFLEVLARDPWMFGLTPEDMSASIAHVPAPDMPTRGVRDGRDARHDRAGQGGRQTLSGGEVDWSSGLGDSGAA